MRVAVLLFAAGCGRFNFDNTSTDSNTTPQCNPTSTHDEDADGIIDDCDVCPWIPDLPQADTDGDRVGDACDPEPANARQRIVLFDPLLTTAQWVPNSLVDPRGDSVKLGGVGAQGALRRGFVPATDQLVIGARTGVAGAGVSLLAILFKDVTDGPAFYCELYDSGIDNTLFYTYTLDGTNYAHPGSAPAARLANGNGSLTADVDASMLRCRSTWSPTSDVSGTRPNTINASVLALYAENIEAELFYFAQIRTEP